MNVSLLDKIKLDKFYQGGVILSFLIFLTTLTFEVRFLNNSIIALYSLSFLLFFMGFWINIKTSSSTFHGTAHSHDSKTEYYKLNKIGLVFYLLSAFILFLAVKQTYIFFR